jgi:hypothetical protein
MRAPVSNLALCQVVGMRDIGALLSKCPFSLFLWLAVWRPSPVSLEAHAELPG